MGRWTDGQTYRQTDRQMNKWMDRQTNGQMGRWADGQMGRWTDGQMDGTDRWADGRNRQTDRLTYRYRWTEREKGEWYRRNHQNVNRFDVNLRIKFGGLGSL